jgi:hypothetical protein
MIIMMSSCRNSLTIQEKCKELSIKIQKVSDNLDILKRIRELECKRNKIWWWHFKEQKELKLRILDLETELKCN